MRIRARWVGLAVGLLYAGLLATAFVVAPHACTWGMDAYVGAGAIVVLLATALPVLGLDGRRRRHRVALAVCAGLAGGAVWVLGIGLARVQLLCQLF